MDFGKLRTALEKGSLDCLKLTAPHTLVYAFHAIWLFLEFTSQRAQFLHDRRVLYHVMFSLVLQKLTEKEMRS